MYKSAQSKSKLTHKLLHHQQVIIANASKKCQLVSIGAWVRLMIVDSMVHAYAYYALLLFIIATPTILISITIFITNNFVI
jgi:hypothetical protein